MSYSISEIASMLKVTPSTLRYYDKEGLLPFVSRSAGGQRTFEDSDYENLKDIECLKKAGMSIKDIKKFISLHTAGDSTIEPRLEMIIQQQKMIAAKMEELQRTMIALDYKRWYYELAKEAGTTSVPANMSEDELPPEFREIRKWLRNKGDE